jgi:hypothetical protein
MQIAATLALLLMVSGPTQAGSDSPDSSPIRLAQATPTDSAHTLVTPNASNPGQAGQTVQLPGGGAGVTTGGTSNYQTVGTPGGGSAVMVPSGGGTSAVMGSGGQTGTTSTPR